MGLPTTARDVALCFVLFFVPWYRIAVPRTSGCEPLYLVFEVMSSTEAHHYIMRTSFIPGVLRLSTTRPHYSCFCAFIYFSSISYNYLC